ncbi:MAG: hydrolase [Pedobacter sp.]|nr:MAG: hydrolase [Pedobacter sp.]
MKCVVIIAVFVLGALKEPLHAQRLLSAREYLERSEEMYARIQHYYRTPYPGLFAESYPSGKADSLTYFEGAGVKEKEVSFLWPFSGMFSATNVLLKIPSVRKKYLPMLDSMALGVEQYRDAKRNPPGYQAYPVQFEKADRYYDDNGLVGIDYAEAYLNTRDEKYLARAKEVFTFIISGWTDQLGGGVFWLEDHHDQKPACTNGMATLTALKLYEGTKNAYYLEWGLKFYNWMHDNLRDSAGVFWNDKKMDGKPNKVYWTYNSGSMLEASVLLYRFTKEKKYLDEARQIAEGAFQHFGAQKKIPQLAMNIDVPWFVTVLCRGYEALYEQDKNDKYVNALIESLDYAWAHTKDANGFLTKSWTTNEQEMKNPKWLLDEACIAELYARICMIRSKR